MTQAITPDTFNRLSASMMEQYHEDYGQAMKRLLSLELLIICGPAIQTSRNLQTALLSAINAGKRAFLGGVTVVLPHQSTTHLTPLPGGPFLIDAVHHFGGKTASVAPVNFKGFTLTAGLRALDDEYCLELVCGDWQGGVTNSSTLITLENEDYFPLGGVAAAAIAVGLAFLKLSGIAPRCADFPVGISLWKPDLNWVDAKAIGQQVDTLPEKIWLLGLGHLGQANLWNLAVLPFSDVSKVQVMLQDFDRVAAANHSAGLLTEEKFVGNLKTMVCRSWLEQIGFDTKITERKFDAHTVRQGSEPFIAVCGFDNAAARQYLEDAGFDLIVEAGLGGSLIDFDDISLHTFPSSGHTAKKLWGDTTAAPAALNQQVLKHFRHLEKDGCGILPMELAGKAISSSFVGMLAGALAISEVVRATNCQRRYDVVFAQLRNLKYLQAFDAGSYLGEAARNGSVPVCTAG